MMEFYVSGQSLKFFSPVVAADSLYYLTARFNFTGEDWDGYSKWAHFRQGETVYDAALDENDEIAESVGLNLTQGQWEIYLTGTKDESRLTTVPVILTVKESGLVDAPLHELPLSVAEQVDLKAADALSLARALKAAADNGEFDGKDGTSLAPLGHFTTAQELENIITDPAPGDVYSVGAEPPYELYVWDGINLLWRNHGQLQGAPGEDGEKGVTFTPSMDARGNLSWSNDGSLENPATVNLMGPKGDSGAQGESGPGAFEKAQEAGYTGTEATFYSALTMMPYHNQRHLPDGADPITVERGNLAADVKVLSFKNVSVAASAWSKQSSPGYADFPYRAAISLSGVTTNHFPQVVFSPEAVLSGSFCPVADSYEGGVYIWSDGSNNAAMTVPVIVCTPTA